ncbi:MAG: hypothetical protein DDT32_00281 [Syntrophomonadaceae bacterium]|nr:hypothetical protein [Bacillota bacterium]
MERSEPSVLDAFARDEEGNLSVWCPHCTQWHHHGQGDGHRLAHCHKPGSPFKGIGYTLRHVQTTTHYRRLPIGGINVDQLEAKTATRTKRKLVPKTSTKTRSPFKTSGGATYLICP